MSTKYNDYATISALINDSQRCRKGRRTVPKRGAQALRDLFFSLYRASFLLLLCLSSCLASPAIMKLIEDVLRTGVEPLRKGIVHIRKIQPERPG